MTREERIAALMDAAWMAMGGLSEALPEEKFSGNDVINAAMNVARQAVLNVCTEGENLSADMAKHNRRAMREVLQRLLLETADGASEGIN